MNRKSEYSAEWRAAAGEVLSAVHVTPAELNAMRAQIMDLMMPLVRLDPDERPPGAMPVRVTLDLFPWFDPEEAK
jgi:hypothetical protein